MTSSPRVVAFDLGSHMAAAWFSTDGSILTREWDLSKTKLRAHRFAAVRPMLTDFFSEWNFQGVVYERPFARGMDATRSLWGYAAILEGTASEACLPVVDATPSEIKSWAAGNPHASKEQMISAAGMFGYTGESEHEADAILLLHYAQQFVHFAKGSA